MELKLKRNDEKGVLIEIAGEDHTFCNALRKELWDHDVDAAGYAIEHSLTTSPVLIVKAKNPAKALENAAESLRKKTKELKSLFSKVK
mgnify:FL=1